MQSFHEHVRRAVEIVGGQAKLAGLIGCAQSEVWRLSNSAKSISPDTAVAISRATKGEVTIADLLPTFVEAVKAEIKDGTADVPRPSAETEAA